ncbi:MAG: 2-amino-4-hydroxy-6-hydroxymethyldihydropteridine diphosphokinase [Actinomycetota bacterium]
MTAAFIGLGSNLGDRMRYLELALGALEARGLNVVAVSSVYETEPIGPLQPDFLNAACRVETELSPEDLLGTLKSIEAALGRTPRQRWGPREIDLDLLLYGDEVIDRPGLSVPHPELTHRPFVLTPLAEIAPGLELPSGEALSALVPGDPRGVHRFGPAPSPAAPSAANNGQEWESPSLEIS